MLCGHLLELLRAWWLAGREKGRMLPGGRLFPGQNPVETLSSGPIPVADMTKSASRLVFSTFSTTSPSVFR